MLIEDRDYCINVQILSMKHELQVTKMAIESLLPQLGNGTTLSLLLNGARRPDIRELISYLPHVKYYDSDQNLGVAGGRNFLLRTEEARTADIVMLADNDALFPNDYIARLARFLISIPDSGIVGGVSLKYSALRPVLDDLFPSNSGYLGCEVPISDCPALAEFLKQRGSMRYFDHLGTHEDWEASYFEDRNSIDALLVATGASQQRTFIQSNARNPEVISAICDGAIAKFRVANVAGCTQAFRRSLVEELGEFNELFNLYGREDVDFSLRAIRAGYQNFIDPSTYIIHGTDRRHGDRSSAKGVAEKTINESRAQTILEYIWRRESFPSVAFRRALLRYLLFWQIRPDGAAEYLNYYLRGIGIAVKQLRPQLTDASMHDLEHPMKALSDLCNHNPLGEFTPANVGRLHDVHQKTQDLDPMELLSDLKQRSRERVITSLRERIRTPEVVRAESRHSGNRVLHRTPSRWSPSPEFDYSRLQQFRDKHKGERCFIIGNGPSLRNTDISLLEDEITFGVNGIFYLTDEVGFIPTYYVVEDNHVIHDNLERIRRYPVPTKFFPEPYAGELGDIPNTHWLPTDWSFYWKSSPHFETPQFSHDISQVIYAGQTVTYLNIQLAHYMGFNQVYLIGVDFSYSVPKSSQIEGLTITSVEDDPNHFHREYFGKGKKWHFPRLHNCLKAFLYARRVFERDEREIYNATVGGCLEALDRTDYHHLFPEGEQLQAPTAPIVYALNLLLRCLREKANGEPIRYVGCWRKQHQHRDDFLALLRREHQVAGALIELISEQPSNARPGSAPEDEPFEPLCSTSWEDCAASMPSWDHGLVLSHIDFEAVDAEGYPQFKKICQSAGIVMVHDCDCGFGGTDPRTSDAVRIFLREVLQSGRSLWAFNGIGIAHGHKDFPLFRGVVGQSFAADRKTQLIDAFLARQELEQHGLPPGSYYAPLGIGRPVQLNRDSEWDYWRFSDFADLLQALMKHHVHYLIGGEGTYFQIA